MEVPVIVIDEAGSDDEDVCSKDEDDWEEKKRDVDYHKLFPKPLYFQYVNGVRVPITRRRRRQQRTRDSSDSSADDSDTNDDHYRTVGGNSAKFLFGSQIISKIKSPLLGMTTSGGSVMSPTFQRSQSFTCLRASPPKSTIQKLKLKFRKKHDKDSPKTPKENKSPKGKLFPVFHRSMETLTSPNNRKKLKRKAADESDDILEAFLRRSKRNSLQSATERKSSTGDVNDAILKQNRESTLWQMIRTDEEER